jgi:outer membrane murein-binding lipoprotein Lpp
LGVVMKKLIASAMIAASLVLSGCSNSLMINGKTHEPYGLLNVEKKSDKICYETNVADVALGIIFIETVIVPVYTFGFDLKEPKRAVDQNGDCN